MWKKALFNYLHADEKIRQLSIPLVFVCNCFVDRKEETHNHVFSMGDIVLGSTV